MAAATAFYGLLSLIPLAALAVSVLGRVLGSGPEAAARILTLLRATVPVEAPAIERAIQDYPLPSGSWFVEAISLLGLLWAGSRLFHTLADVLTRVWAGHGRGRSLVLRNLVAVAATAAGGVIFLGILLVTAAAAALTSRASALQELPELIRPMPWLSALGPPAAAWLMFLLAYQFLPQERVRWREAMIGAGVAAVLWEISRMAFATLVTQSAAYGQLYGSLAGTVVVTVWIYLSATILLLGAELAVVLQDRAEAEGR
jgi:membrane protein